MAIITIIPPEDPSSPARYCPKCEQMIPMSQFSRNKRMIDGLGTYCRSCVALRAKSAYTPNVGRIWNLKRNYGISLEEFDSILEAQGNACAICHCTESGGKNWHVDHDHNTGAIRGLLCNSCNTALGHMRDSPAILRAAADYVERHGK